MNTENSNIDRSTMIKQDEDLQQILKCFEVSHKDLSRVCEDPVFLSIIKLMKCHDEVGPYLGISKQEIEEIGRDNVTERKKKMAILWEWKRKKGSSASYLALIQAFLSMNDRSTGEAIANHAAKLKRNQQLTFIQQKELSPSYPRYPNWESLDTTEKEEIKQKLVVENHKVRRAYSNTFLDIAIDFETRNVNPRHIKMSLNTYIRGASLQASAEIQTALSQVPNEVDALFLFISEHTSWLNYHLLEVVVQKLGSEESQRMLCNYEEEHLVPYLDQSVFEISCDSAGSNSGYRPVKFFFKIVDDILVTGKEAIVIRDKLSNLLKVPLLELDSFRVGCMELIFTVPCYLFDSYPKDSPLHTFIKWDESRNEYMLVADLPTILLGGDNKTEALLLRKMLDYRQSRIEEISEVMQDCEANLQRVVHQLQKKEILIEAVEEMETSFCAESSNEVHVVGEKRRLPTVQEDHAIKKPKTLTDNETIIDQAELEEMYGFNEVQDSMPLLSDVTCIAQVSFTIASDEVMILKWEEYGLRMHIEQDSLPPGEHCDLTIRALLCGHYRLPQDSILVSGVYAISTTHKLLKPALIEIQHCVSIDKNEDGDSLDFVMSNAPQPSSPYVFTRVNGGVFVPNSNYCKLQLRKKWLMLGVVTRKNSMDEASTSDRGVEREGQALYPKVSCMLQVFRICPSPNTWIMKFVITQALNIIDTYLEAQNFRLMCLYNVKQRLKKDFHFSDSQLVLHTPMTEVIDGSITQNNVILEESVHNVSDPSKIPMCEAVIRTSSIADATPVQHNAIVVTGTKENMDFYIRI